MGSLKDPTCHDDLLNYQLKRLVTLGGAPAIRLCEGGYGIARAEWHLIAVLVENGPTTLGTLAERAHMERARVSRIVSILVEKGFVERATQAPKPGAVLLEATVRGHALYRDLLPRLVQINRNLMTVLSEEEAALLRAFLRRLTTQAEAIYMQGGGVEMKTDRYRGASRRTAPLQVAAAHESSPGLAHLWRYDSEEG